ncbi:PRI3-like protein [Schizophyllum fasciatum]
MSSPLDARDGDVANAEDVPDDRTHCRLKDAIGHRRECTPQTAQQCWDSGGDCTYSYKTKRCSNVKKTMRGAKASFACRACQCTAR